MPCTFSCQLPRAVSTSTGTVKPALAPAAQQRQAVDLRQAEIEHDGVVALGLAEKLGALAVGGAVHGVARLAERRGELLATASPRLQLPVPAPVREPPWSAAHRYNADQPERELNAPFTVYSAALV